jgi:hypothetical protein
VCGIGDIDWDGGRVGFDNSSLLIPPPKQGFFSSAGSYLWQEKRGDVNAAKEQDIFPR